MASISSGSSDDEDTSFTTTDVLLGYASKAPTDDPFSQLGGHPVSRQHGIFGIQVVLTETSHGQMQPAFPHHFLPSAKCAID